MILDIIMNSGEKRLLQHYLSLAQDHEARRWNLSPEAKYLEFATRHFLTGKIQPFPGMQVCNVGIGAGEWDNFLGLWLSGSGALTSIDIDPTICDEFSFVQNMERHPNPSKVCREDILADKLPAQSFDLVTIIGSTVAETKDYTGALRSCSRLIKTGGHLHFMEFFQFWASRV